MGWILSISLFTACTGPEKNTDTGAQSGYENQSGRTESVNAESDLVRLRQQYEKDLNYRLSAETYTLQEGERLDIETELNKKADFETYFKDAGQPTPFIIYTDSSLNDVLFVPEAEVDGEGKIKIDPADMKAKEISYGAEESPIKLAGEGSWGNYETLYLVQFNDLKKGRKLDKPIIYIMDIQHGENTVRKPVIDYTVNNQGDLQVNWEPVENASRYHVLKRYDMNHFYDHYKDLIGDALDHYFYYESHFEYMLLGTTTSATWTSADASLDIATKSYSEDDIASEESKDDLALIEQVEEEPRNYDLVILAENAQGACSPLSNAISSASFAGLLPKEMAVNILDTQNPNGFTNVSDVPTVVPVVMMDGSIRNFTMEYDVGGIYQEGEYKIPFKVSNTKITGKISIDGSMDNYQEILASKMAENAQKGLTGLGEVLVLKEDGSTFDVPDAEVADSVADTDLAYVASSALEEYIVTNMLEGNQYLDMAEFPEARDGVILEKAFHNIAGNNPIITYTPRYYYSRERNILQLTISEEDLDLQDRIMEKVKSLEGSVVKEGMSDLEISEAINQYLCDSAEYNYEALAAYDEFKASNESVYSLAYADFQAKNGEAFSVEGILLQGTGVCAGYAQAYQVIATYYGLDTRYVTGTTPGGRHAWNLIRLDGEWRVVDVTWNDSQNPNQYLHVSQTDEPYASTHSLDADFAEYLV